jgi:hypothetical protein
VSATDFEALWPELQAQLTGYLLKRGVARELADEVLQDTALRLLGCWERIDHSRPLGPLAKKIAWNLLVDHHRRTPVLLVADLPDMCSVYDIEEHRALRTRLRAAADGLRQLRDQDRAVLLAEIGVGQITGNRMARMRARRRLKAIVDQAASSLAAVPIGLRRMFGWSHAGSTSDALNAAATAGVLVAVSLVALSLDSRHDAHAQSGNPPVRPEALVRLEDPGFSIRESDRRLADSNQTITPAGSAADGSGPTEKSPSTQENDVDAKAGPARAEKGQGEGYVYVQVCLGEDTESEEDDYGVTVVLFDGGQSGEEEAPECRYEDEGDGDD